MPRLNEFGQPIGADLPDWTPRSRPPRLVMEGHTVRIEPIDPARHAAEIMNHLSRPADDPLWTYLAYGPFRDGVEYRDYLAQHCLGDDPLMHAVIDKATGKAVGQAAYLRIDPANGVIEVGHLLFTPVLQRRVAATEAMYLMMARAFDELGYRRYEWKCDALNAPSRTAALRLGFTFEGVFRQAVVTKGRNRDTAWFAITDQEWPAIRLAFQTWLAPGNFDTGGRQKTALRARRG